MKNQFPSSKKVVPFDNGESQAIVVPLPPNGGKRPRRLRSAAGASHNGSVAKKISIVDCAKRTSDDNHEETKSDGDENLSTVPIFVQKTYRMVDEGDPDVIGWTPNGEMFIIKDPKQLEKKNVIGSFFDHNNFSSFDRQLNFYGFRKIQNKPIKNKDHNPDTSKFVIYHNENFQRGRTELLLNIVRSTKHKNLAQKAEAEIRSLKGQVSELRETVEFLKRELDNSNILWESRIQSLEHVVSSMMPSYLINGNQIENQNQRDVRPIDTPQYSSVSSQLLTPHPKTKANVSNIPPAPKLAFQDSTLTVRDLSTNSVGISFQDFMNGERMSNLRVASPSSSPKAV